MPIPGLAAIVTGAKAILGKAVVQKAAETVVKVVAGEAVKKVTKEDNTHEVIAALRAQVEELEARAQEQDELNSELAKQGQHVADALAHLDMELTANNARQEELISQMALRSQTLLLISGVASVIAIVALVFALL